MEGKNEKNSSSNVKKNMGIIAAVLAVVAILMFVLKNSGAGAETLYMISRAVVVVCFVISCVLFVLRVRRERKIHTTDIISALTYILIFYVIFR